MFNAISNAEIGSYHVELLPARTALSMYRTDIGGLLGGGAPSGTTGHQGGAGKSPFDLLSWFNQPGTADPATAAAGAPAAGSSST